MAQLPMFKPGGNWIGRVRRPLQFYALALCVFGGLAAALILPVALRPTGWSVGLLALLILLECWLVAIVNRISKKNGDAL